MRAVSAGERQVRTAYGASVADAQEAAARSIRGFRAAAGLRQVELAERLNLSQTVVSDLENNVRALTLMEVVHVCRALNVSLVELLRGADPEDLEALGLR